jgi:potassium-transporting ATPase KdpC subunit
MGAGERTAWLEALADIGRSLRALVVLTLLLGVAYPLVMTGLGGLLWSHQAHGSLVKVGGRVVGSELIGQVFAGNSAYFQSRPSSSGYEAAGTGASNLGPNSADLSDRQRLELRAYLARERPYLPTLTAAEVPPEAVTASASGVDPDIAVGDAHIQAHRVARVRQVSLAMIDEVIARNTHQAAGGLFGPASVNVLELNLALDRLRP